MSEDSKSRVMRLSEVMATTGLSRSAIYLKGDSRSRYFDAQFPPRFKLGERSVGWSATEVMSWVTSKMESRVQR